MEGTVVVDWFCWGAPASALPREDSHVGGHGSHRHPATICPKRATQEPTTSDWEKQSSFFHLVWFSKGRCKGLFSIRSSISNSCTLMGSSRDREVRPSLLWTLSPAASQAGRALPFLSGLDSSYVICLVCAYPHSPAWPATDWWASLSPCVTGRGWVGGRGAPHSESRLCPLLAVEPVLIDLAQAVSAVVLIISMQVPHHISKLHFILKPHENVSLERVKMGAEN